MTKDEKIIEIKECIDAIYGADCAYFGVDGFAIANEICEKVFNKDTKWISVKENLPSALEEVLVTDGKKVSEGFILISRNKRSYFWITALPVWPTKVTHWMPLPEAPSL